METGTAEVDFKVLQYRENAAIFQFFLGWRFRTFLFLIGLMNAAIFFAYLASSTPTYRGYVFAISLLVTAIVIAICGIVFDLRFRAFIDFSGSYLRGQDDVALRTSEHGGTYFQQYAHSTSDPRKISNTSLSNVIRATYIAHALACLAIGVAL